MSRRPFLELSAGVSRMLRSQNSRVAHGPHLCASLFRCCFARQRRGCRHRNAKPRFSRRALPLWTLSKSGELRHRLKYCRKEVAPERHLSNTTSADLVGSLSCMAVRRARCFAATSPAFFPFALCLLSRITPFGRSRPRSAAWPLHWKASTSAACTTRAGPGLTVDKMLAIVLRENTEKRAGARSLQPECELACRFMAGLP